MERATPVAGFDTVERAQWSARGAPAPSDLVRSIAAAPVPPVEIREVYVPLARLLESRIAGGRPREGGGRSGRRRPFLVGIAGGVAVGKSTVAGVLQGLLHGGPGAPAVELVSTDAFLYPNDVLAARGLLGRKGFPETYDLPSLVGSLAAIRSGAEEVAVPVYSHLAYDIDPDGTQWIRHPDVVIVEGLNVLQAPPGASVGGPAAPDFLDASLYVDASEEDAARWFRERLLALRAAATPASVGIIGWLASLSDEEAEAGADAAWAHVNLVNVREHVAPTRDRAGVVLQKEGSHRVARVLLRRT